MATCVKIRREGFDLYQILPDGSEIKVESGSEIKVPDSYGTFLVQGLTVTRKTRSGFNRYSVKLTKDGIWKFGPYFGHRILPEGENNLKERIEINEKYYK